MGIFSSKKKTYVGTSASRLVEDNMVPNSVMSGTTKGVLQTGDISASVIQELSRSVGTRARSMYNFGRNNYVFGNPDAKIKTSLVQEEEVLAVLQTIYGGTIVLEYSKLGAPNIIHNAWLKLVQSYGYDPVTNQLGGLTASMGRPVFLNKLVVVLPLALQDKYSDEATEHWGKLAHTGVSPTRIVSNSVSFVGALRTAPPAETHVGADDYTRVEYAWTDASNNVQVASFNLEVPELEEDDDYFQAGFYHNGVRKFWTYLAGQGTYPNLDGFADNGQPSQTSGTFFPMIHFRSNKQSLAANTESIEYTHSVKMAKKLGMDYMELHDAIHENPDIADIAQAYLAMLVPVASTDELDQRYLFDFFDRLDNSSAIPQSEDDLKKLFNFKARSVILIEDKKMKHTLSCTGVTKRKVTGNLGAGIKYSSGFETVGGKRHYFRKQLTDYVYEELTVYGLEMRYFIAGKHQAVGDETDAALLIPVDYSISRTYPLQLQEKLYLRSLHLVANSMIVVKVKWYQRGAFGTLLKVIGVVLIFFDGGFTLALANAIAQGVIAVITFIVTTIVINLVVKFAFSLLAKILGPEFSILLAVVAAIHGGAQILEKGLKAALPAVTQLLQFASNLLQGTAKVVMDDLLELGKEFDRFKDETEEKMKLLEDAKSLLENSARLNPIVIFGETPDNYYNRTVHSGNVGTIGYLAIESYADMALTLPTISDSLGGVQNEV